MGSNKYGKILKSPIGLMLITAIVYSTYIFIYFSLNQYSPSAFLWLGEDFVQKGSLSSHSVEKISKNGYDGQFFYRLALEPLTNKKTDFGITIDNPPYRQQRILYPLLVWSLAGGNPSSTVFFMVLINFLSICGLTFFGARLLDKLKSDMYGVLFISFYPGFAISITRGLCEPLAIFFVFLCFYSFLKRECFISSITLALAVLTKETTLLIAVGAGLVWLSSKTRKENPAADQIPAFFFIIPGLIYLAWQLYLFQIWGTVPVLAAANVGMPFIGMLSSFSSLLSFKDIGHFIYLIEIIWIFIFGGYCLFQLSDGYRLFSIPWMLYAILALMLGTDIWDNHPGFYRALFELHMLGILIVMRSGSRLKYYFLSLWPVFWLVASSCEIYIQSSVPFIPG
ncbi:MAG: hypothetical protein KGY61_00440 [Desulfobacterales bacterium]|nr:hypothetical protein [Desulfobacterales bacterium]